MAWTGQFVSIDGEGWGGKYTLLAVSCMGYDLYNKNGLSTLDCLEYLTAWKIPRNAAVVGFGLSYDFENILRDVPDEDYLKMTEEGERIRFHEFELMYIPRKILEVTRHTGKTNAKGKEVKKTVYIQDVQGFFQSSFEAALKKWDIPVPEIITEFKALRNEFSPKMIEKIKLYNREELRLLIELMEKLRTADCEAFEAIGLDPKHTPRTWYGAGARAAIFLRQTAWVEEHPPFNNDAARELSEKIIERASLDTEGEHAAQLKEHPFAASFYGGRIEAAAVGTFKVPLYDYDINSAYPFAFGNLPYWNEDDLIAVEGLDPAARIGMYYVEWNCPEGFNFYPFPYRSKSGNVFFPRRGRGWYMSPEVYAAREVWGDAVTVVDGYVLKDTDGAGDGLGGLSEEKLCTSARYIKKMAAVRLVAKAAKESKEKSLKLVINSVYGKTVQQVGSHKFLNMLAASWITSTCRSLILRTIRDGAGIVSVMTDGILSLNPLPVSLGKNLGEFEVDEFSTLIQFMPGVYYLERPDGSVVSRYRGMSKDFSPKEAVKVLHTREERHPIIMRIFVTRRLALHQPTVFGNKRYYFVEVQKDEEFTLQSKRTPVTKGFRLKKKEPFKFFPPKEADPLEIMFSGSKPYKLDAPALLAYDTAATVQELVDDNRISSALECETEGGF